MSEHIKVGDLVVITRPYICCGRIGGIGLIFRVTGFNDVSGVPCHVCGDRGKQMNALYVGASVGIDTRRLTRIPPLSELEVEKRDEEIKA